MVRLRQSPGAVLGLAVYDRMFRLSWFLMTISTLTGTEKILPATLVLRQFHMLLFHTYTIPLKVFPQSQKWGLQIYGGLGTSDFSFIHQSFLQRCNATHSHLLFFLPLFFFYLYELLINSLFVFLLFVYLFVCFNQETGKLATAKWLKIVFLWTHKKYIFTIPYHLAPFLELLFKLSECCR